MSNLTSAPAVVLDQTSPIVRDVVAQVRARLRDGARYSAYVTAYGVTRESVKDHSYAIARLITPETSITVRDDEGKQVRTKFGNAQQAARAGLLSVLDKRPATKSTALLTTLGKAATREQVIAAWEEAQQ